MALQRRVIQRFEILEQLGAGGMGSVLRAWDPQLQRDVAIKVLSESTRDAALELSAHETLDLRGNAPPSQGDLLSEARLMARLSHPNVLPVYEVGLADGVVFVVMEYIAGSNLEQWLAHARTQDEILDTFAQAGRGLAAAHACGIVHRDFKPQNVLIGSDGRARVADFGLSRLVVPAPNALVRIDDGRGTPRYMAPELWRGDPATTRSDVFAFCMALAEALAQDNVDLGSVERQLRARGVTPRLRALLAAGLAEDPAERPELPRLIAALEGKRSRRWWFAAGGGAAVTFGVLAAVFTVQDAPASCDLDSEAGLVWNEPQRVLVRGTLIARPGATPKLVERVIRSLDANARAIDAHLVATCKAKRTGKVTDDQAIARASCIRRRAFELGAIARWLQSTKAGTGEIENRVHALPGPDECVELTSSPLSKDVGPVVELFERYIAITDLPYRERVAPLVALERDAAARGEAELEVRTTLQLGVMQRISDDPATSDVTLQRAYQRAVDIHAVNNALLVLIDRSPTLAMKGDAAGALRLAEMAAAQVEKPIVSARTKARVYSALGSALVERGEYLAGIEKLRTAMDVIARDGHRLGMIEVGVRFRLIDALINQDQHVQAGIDLARETLEFVRQEFGEHHADFGTALNKIAYGMGVAGDSQRALPYRQQALAVMLETLPANSSAVLGQRTAIGYDYFGMARYEDARQVWAEVVDEVDKNPALQSNRATLLGALGAAVFNVGRHDEGLRLIKQGLDGLMAQYGLDHSWTQAYRRDAMQYLLELGRLDDAEAELKILDASYRRRAESRELRLARLHGISRAQLELSRGRPQQAETLVRETLAGWDQLGGDRLDRHLMWSLLASCLIEQKRWDAARLALETARGFARPWRTDELAKLDVKLARIDAALGLREQALERAQRASTVLAKFPGEILSRKEVAKLLSQLVRR